MKKWLINYLWTAWHLMFIVLFGTLTIVSFAIGRYAAVVLGIAFTIWTIVDLCQKIIKIREKENNK